MATLNVPDSPEYLLRKEIRELEDDIVDSINRSEQLLNQLRSNTFTGQFVTNSTSRISGNFVCLKSLCQNLVAKTELQTLAFLNGFTVCQENATSWTVMFYPKFRGKPQDGRYNIKLKMASSFSVYSHTFPSEFPMKRLEQLYLTGEKRSIYEVKTFLVRCNTLLCAYVSRKAQVERFLALLRTGNFGERLEVMDQMYCQYHLSFKICMRNDEEVLVKNDDEKIVVNAIFNYEEEATLPAANAIKINCSKILNEEDKKSVFEIFDYFYEFDLDQAMIKTFL